MNKGMTLRSLLPGRPAYPHSALQPGGGGLLTRLQQDCLQQSSLEGVVSHYSSPTCPPASAGSWPVKSVVAAREPRDLH